MATTQLTQANFEQTITNNNIVLVDFWAPWCGPCRNFAPIFEEVSEKYPDVVFGKVNTDEERDLGGQFQIRSIPTLMIFREQIILFSQAGSLPESALEEVIGKALALDMETVRAEMAKQEPTEKA
ncbi:thioredoxin [Candidatus Parabeggiatoa sp. HSG14]|uniref:thioredoxin n=1 Tax=Candidatus Parabeggiatoa sp. HSG14 TaxID=3055593 RepID=UPI0025A77D79|nr:thioredoxin [Thiotrichales bacterium HSG14]